MTKIKNKIDITEKLAALLETEGFKKLKTATIDENLFFEYVKEEGDKITIIISR